MAAGNLKETWKMINRLTKSDSLLKCSQVFDDNGKTVVNEVDIANKFNTYFANIGKTLAANISSCNSNFSKYLKNDYCDSMSLLPTNHVEVAQIVMQLENKASSGFDDIPVSVMKKTIHNVAPYISSIINCSFEIGICPDQLKIAKVCPVYKSDDKAQFSNYRPISVLPSFSKIFEKIMFNRLTNYLDSK